MDSLIIDHLNTLEFPKLIEEKSVEACYENFCQDYELLLKALDLKHSSLSENLENNHLISALLKTLAERESLLRYEINQILQVLIPAPNNAKNGAKNQQLDAVVALFGMTRNFTLDKESGESLYEPDEAVKKRIPSRLGILSKTGTKSAYIHTFLALEPSLNDIAIMRPEEDNNPKLTIYLLPKIETFLKKNNKSSKQLEHIVEEWLTQLRPTLETKIKQSDIIPIRDNYTLAAGNILTFSIDITYPDNEKTLNTIKKIVKNYCIKKYRFNSVVSRSELLSYFNYPLIEKVEIKFQVNEKNKEFLACQASEAPFIEKITINKQEYKLEEIFT